MAKDFLLGALWGGEYGDATKNAVKASAAQMANQQAVTNARDLRDRILQHKKSAYELAYRGEVAAAREFEAQAAKLERLLEEHVKIMSNQLGMGISDYDRLFEQGIPKLAQAATASWPSADTDMGRKGLIASRLRLKPGMAFPFEKSATFVEGEKVYVFIVLPNGPVTLEDDEALFPSDTLMAQLRLLL